MTSLPKASESMRERNRIGCVIRVNNRKNSRTIHYDQKHRNKAVMASTTTIVQK